MYYNPSKSMPKSQIMLEQSQIMKDSQIYKENSSHVDIIENQTPNQSQFLISSNKHSLKKLPKSFKNLSKSSFGNLPIVSKNRINGKQCINSKSIINSQSVLMDSQSIINRDLSLEKSAKLTKQKIVNKSEFFEKTRDKVKRFMDKSLPSCSLFIRAKTMTEVAYPKIIPSKTIKTELENKIQQEEKQNKLSISFDQSFEKNLEQEKDDSNQDESVKPTKLSAKQSLLKSEESKKRESSSNKQLSIQNIEIPIVTENSNLPSIQNINEKTNSHSQNILYPTPLNSIQLKSQNLNQNIYSRPSIVEDNPVQEIQIYSHSRPESESLTINSTISKQPSNIVQAGKYEDKLGKEYNTFESEHTKKEYKIDTHSDGIQGIDTRFSEYTPREIDSLIYNNFSNKNMNCFKDKSDSFKNINIPNLYDQKNRLNEEKIREINQERVSVSVSMSNNNHEVIENIDQMYVSTNAFDNSKCSEDPDNKKLVTPGMDTFRGTKKQDSVSNMDNNPESNNYIKNPMNVYDDQSELNENTDNENWDELLKNDSNQNIIVKGQESTPHVYPKQVNELDMYKESNVLEKLPNIKDQFNPISQGWSINGSF